MPPLSSTHAAGEALPWQAGSSAEVQSQQGQSHRLAHHNCLEAFKKSSHLSPISPISLFSGRQGAHGKSALVAGLRKAAVPCSCPQPRVAAGHKLGHQLPTRCGAPVLQAGVHQRRGEGGCPGTTTADLPLQVSLCWVTGITPCKSSNPQNGSLLTLY